MYKMKFKNWHINFKYAQVWGTGITFYIVSGMEAIGICRIENTHEDFDAAVQCWSDIQNDRTDKTTFIATI